VRVRLQWTVYLILLLSVQPTYSQTPTALPTLNIKAPKGKRMGKGNSNHYTYTHAQIKKTGSTSVSQFLQKQGIVSIQGSSSVGNQHSISLHGFGTNANQNSLVQIDGIPDTSLSNVSAELNNLMPQNIDSITVLPGSYGARYGNQAVGGVVNIKTLNPNKTIHELQFGIGNNNQRLASIFYSQRYTNHLGVNLGFSGQQDNHSQPHNQQRHYILNGKLDYVGARGNVSLNFLGYQDNSQIPGYYTVGNSRLNTDDNDFINSRGALSYLTGDFYFAPHWHWHGTLANNHSDSSGHLNDPFQNNQMQWLVQNSVHYQSYFTLGNQLDFARYGSQNGTSVNQNANEFDNAFFATGTIPVENDWDFNLGIRYASQELSASPAPGTHATKRSDALVSTEGVTWHIQPDIKWYLRRAGNFVFAKGNEQMWSGGPNLALKTQTGVSYETGIDWQPHQDEFKVSLYQLDLNNEISMFINHQVPYPIITNIPPTRRLGMDALARIEINQQWQTLLQATLVSARFRSGQYKNNQVPSVSPYQGSIALTYHNQQGWQAWVNETYHSSFYAANDFDNTGSQLSGYFLTNFHIAKTWHAITLGLSINNVFNRRFARYAYSYKQSDSTIVNYYLGDGISAMGTITLQF